MLLKAASAGDKADEPAAGRNDVPVGIEMGVIA